MFLSLKNSSSVTALSIKCQAYNLEVGLGVEQLNILCSRYYKSEGSLGSGVKFQTKCKAHALTEHSNFKSNSPKIYEL